MIINDIMTKMPWYAEESVTIGDVINKLSELQLRHLPIVRDKELVGIVSDRDLKGYYSLLFEAAGDIDFSDAGLNNPIASIMHTDVISVDRNDDISDAVRLMVDERIGAVPVVDNNTLVGIVSYVDILKTMLAEEPA